MVAGRLQLAGRGGGRPHTPESDGVVAIAVVPEIGGAHDLPDAATAMASRSKGLWELSTPPTTVVGAKRRRWRSDKVRCCNAGLRWASSSAKVSAVCILSWWSQSGCQRRLYRDVEDAVVSPWLCSGHGERVRVCDAYARRWRSRAEGSASPPFFPLLRVSVWLNKRVVVVLLCYRLAKPEQELVLQRGPFMASTASAVSGERCGAP